MSTDFDLLGDPIPENWGKRGRPPHIPTNENRNKVMLLMGMDWPNARIANALGITEPTLRKHYFRELRAKSQARDRVEGNLLSYLWAEARSGNVAAAKEFARQRELIDRRAADAAWKEDEDRAAPPPAGKKEQAMAAAQTAGLDSDWGDDLVAARPRFNA